MSSRDAKLLEPRLDLPHEPKMNQQKPPAEIDGAKVLEWAWSGDVPFGEVPGADMKIFGLAITTYDRREYYRFACDRDWETQQDALYASNEDAKNQLPDQYRMVEVNWVKRQDH